MYGNSGINVATREDHVPACEFCPDFEGGYEEVRYDRTYDPTGAFWDCPECGAVNRKDVGDEDG